MVTIIKYTHIAVLLVFSPSVFIILKITTLYKTNDNIKDMIDEAIIIISKSDSQSSAVKKITGKAQCAKHELKNEYYR